MTASPQPATVAPSTARPVLDQDGLQKLTEDFVSRRIARGGGGGDKKEGLSYQPAAASAWAAALAGALRDEARAFLGGAQSRHKVVAHVIVTQRVGQGLARSAGCLWAAGGGGTGSSASASAGGPPPQADMDGCGWATAENDQVGVLAEVYALYVH